MFSDVFPLVVSKKKQKEANESVRRELQRLADKIEKLARLPDTGEELKKLRREEKLKLGLIDSYDREVRLAMKLDVFIRTIDDYLLLH